ncbi:tannase/feruloyl esterase family alpha/beta hydrolase [Paenibacillus beijingensis]|uniref:Tannase n=1 Tax=Paenibacillus beijingensis TaxID=1126833 RepID=A0A0D5NLM6_9BACL|nr:tannase/feruloyl esterase family alpha/beta hydrolase [Paenibacillus beijingensis]AJY76146.1 hypothetical protein VN24_18270 [Paenibacillus beijingensis]
MTSFNNELNGLQIPASAFELPTSGATVISATIVSETEPGNVNGEYCKVLGAIHPVDKNAWDIHFEVNLPADWNRKALQMGGGGFNGSLVTGLENNNYDPEGSRTPLARGYATFGSDSGHVGVGWDAAFMLNDEALANFGGNQLKKTYDAAMYIIKAWYNEAPSQTYFSGGSTGGREALNVIQRWPENYDGAVALYPVHNWVAKVLADNRNAKALYAKGGLGWISPEQNKILNDKVRQICDSLDGIEDGIMSDLTACQQKLDQILEQLRCPDGGDDASCFTEDQIEVIKTFHSPMELGFSLANELRTMPGYSQLEGADLGVQFGQTPIPDTPLSETTDGVMGVFAQQVIRFAIAQNPEFNAMTFYPDEWISRLQEVSEIVDATDPDLSVFMAAGGKLILVHGTADEVVTPYGSVQYYKQLEKRFGKEDLDQFVRFYLIPGYGHGGGAFQMSADLLGALDDWVVGGTAPGNLVAADKNPGNNGRTRPMCPYPSWPKYNGTGDVNSAASYTCTING